MADPLYGNVNDPAEANDTPVDAQSPGYASFDELSEYGVSPNLANIPVPWKRVTPKKVMADTSEGEVPAYSLRDVPGTDIENLTYDEAVRSLYGNSPEITGSLQLQMAAGGFYGKNPFFVDKAPDDNTRNAWNEVLRISMRSNKTPGEVIGEAIEANGGLEEGLKKRGLSGAGVLADIPVSHPDDIRMVAKEVSRKVLGKGWDAKQLESFVATYQAQEAAAKQAAQASGAKYTQAPSMEAAAESEARRANPVAAEATDWDGAAQMMIQAFQVLGGGE